MLRRPPRSPLFPYTTLVRSGAPPTRQNGGMAGQPYLDAIGDAVPEGAEPELFTERRTFLLDHVEPGDLVLDVGCGEGAFAAAIGGLQATPVCVEDRKSVV